MDRLMRGNWTARRSAFRGLAFLAGGLAWITAAALAAVLAVFFAATMVVVVLMATALLAVGGMALKARRTVRARAGSDLIEARNVGGHSWVAYGWDGQR
jgi:cobalamin biosynthesis protein CobD/CbiB